MPFPVDESRIIAAEAELGRRLPEKLRKRLLRNNGGEIAADGEVWQLHPVWDPSNRRTVVRTASHVVAETRSAREWPAFPDDAVAIAANGTGDLLIVRVGETIERWCHETGSLEPLDDVGFR